VGPQSYAQSQRLNQQSAKYKRDAAARIGKKDKRRGDQKETRRKYE
jgi:hypothetical protein